MANSVTQATSTDPTKRTKRTQESVEAVLRHIAQGENVVDALKLAKVKKRTFYDWKAADPELQTKFAEACKTGEPIQQQHAMQESLRLAEQWATTGMVTKKKRQWIESNDPNAPPAKKGAKPEKVIVTEETTVNPKMLIQVLALKMSVQAKNGEGQIDADIYKILNEAHGGLAP